MALPTELSKKQLAIRRFLLTESAKNVAYVLKKNKRIMSDFVALKSSFLSRVFLREQDNFNRLIKYLEIGDENDPRVLKARQRIKQSLQVQSHLIPTKELELTHSPLKKQLIAIERQEELEKARYNVRQPLSILKAVKNMSVVTAGFIRLDKRDLKHLSLKAVAAPAVSSSGFIMLSSFLLASTLPQDAKASAPDPLTLVSLLRRKKNDSIQFNTPIVTGNTSTLTPEILNFNKAVMNALKARPDRSAIKKPSASAEMGKQNVPGLAVSNTGKITYTNQDQTWTVPQEVYNSNFLTAQITGVPARYMFAVQALESSFNPNSVNHIKACGLSQFVPTTLHEKAYKYGALIGFPEVKNLIKRYVKKRDKKGRPYFGYKPKNTIAEKKLAKICLDPDFNTRLGAVNMMLDIGYLQRNLAKYAPSGDSYYPITELHGYTAHFSGGGAGYKVLKDVLGKDGVNHAYKSFSSGARNDSTNKKLLYVDGNKNNPRTTKQFIKFLGEIKGLSNTILPDMRNFGKQREHIVAQIEKLDSHPNTVTASLPSNLMGFSPQQ